MRLCNVKPLATATVMPMIVVTTASSQRNVPFGWMMGSCIQSTSQALAKYIGFSLGMAKDSSDVLSLFYYIVPRALMLLARRAASRRGGEYLQKVRLRHWREKPAPARHANSEYGKRPFERRTHEYHPSVCNIYYCSPFEEHGTKSRLINISCLGERNTV